MKKNSNKSVFTSHFLFLILITLVVCTAYGINITKLSFYGDDWIYIYNYHIAGPGSFSGFQQTDRPYSAWVYVLTTAFFGESAAAYHILVFFLRWLAVVLFWRILSDAFGENTTVKTAALLFAVYPGFQQQPIAVEFVMHFSSLVLVLASIWLMQTACRLPSRKKIFLIILSLAAGGTAIFTCEYFIGLELARPLFLFFTFQQILSGTDSKAVLKKTALYIIPYACMTVFYFIWRIFIFSFTSYAPKLLIALRDDPVSGIRQLIEKVIQDLITVLIRSYRLIFSRPADISLIAAAAMLVLISAAVFLVLHRPEVLSAGSTENFKMLILGTALLFFSGIPYWGTFLDVSVSFPWDRSTFSFSPGAALFIAVLLSFILKPVFFITAAALLTSLSVIFHVQNTNVYIREAGKMNDYFWQLAWRAPDLEKGTILISEQFPLDRTSDNDLSPIVNWQYAPENRGLSYDYKYFDLDLREGFYYTDPQTSVPVEHIYRSHYFSSTTEKSLGIFYKKNGCLQIIDETNTGYPDLPESLIRTSVISKPDLILTMSSGSAQPPEAIGAEPEHGYCYYFQKISLAQQKGDAENAYALALDVLNAELHPTYASDLGPIVLAFLNAGDFSSADTVMSGSSIGHKDTKYLCDFWQNQLSPENNDPELRNFYKSHGCL